MDGIEHLEHSRSRDHYVAWQRERILSMLSETDLHPGEYDEVLAREREVREQRDRVERRNRDLRLVLDSIDQGMIHLDSNGVIASERSAAFIFGESLGDKDADTLLDALDPQTQPRRA